MKLKSVGFPISSKENEKRRVLIPNDIKRMKHPEKLYFEKNYGSILGFKDEDYRKLGCNICSREFVLKCDIICDAKIGDEDYLSQLSQGQSIFGWIHATQNRDITDKIVESKISAYAWEKMFDRGRHVFWMNNVLAGEAAVIHAFQCFGKLPYGLKVAVLGRGNTAKGALKVLDSLGARTIQYNRKTEVLFRDELPTFDVIVNCILWDINRKDHIIYKKDLRRMKRNSMIIDVSCDKNGGIETSVPTTINKPTYTVDGVLHYVVDHTPAIFYKTFTENNSKAIYKHIEALMEDKPDKTLSDSLIIDCGKIIDKEILKFQNRNNYNL